MRPILLLIFLIVTDGYAQREASIWYFGINAGLDFNSGRPQVLLDGQIDTVEGCESFSDSEGNLLFYTEGNNVWNRNHQIMPNGTALGGSFSTSQSALVIPNPANDNLYYIFTPDDALTAAEESTNGFNYSIVDMSLDGGLGDVVEKDNDLLTMSSETVSAIRNMEDDFYWVITHFRDSFYAYRVDSQGVNVNPVVTKIGPDIISFENTRGSLKIAPDGTKLAIAHTIVEPQYSSGLYLYDFDVETGRVSNGVSLGSRRIYYGVEFSSNSSKLYASGIMLANLNGDTVLGNQEIVQFDLNETNPGQNEFVISSKPNRPENFVGGALQLAIDKKIYHALPGEALSVIRRPNLKGIDADFRFQKIDLGGRRSSYGLPPFIQSFFETIVSIDNFCEGQETTFELESNGQIESVNWNFGDSNSGTENFSNELNPSHIFSSHGNFTVTLTVNYNNGSSRSFIEFVEIAEIPNLREEVTLVQCDVDGIDDGIATFNLLESISLFNKGNLDVTAYFFESESDALCNISQIDPLGYINIQNNQTIYARAFENSECFALVEIELEVAISSDLGLYDTIYVCDGFLAGIAARINITPVYETIKNDFPAGDIWLYKRQEEAVYEENPIPLGEVVFGPFDEHAVYFRVENENACAFIGRLDLNISEKPEYEDPTIIYLCKGEAELNAMEGFKSYRWSNDRTEPNILVTSPGIVDVVFGNDNCNYVQTFEIREAAPVVVEKIEVVDFQQSNMVRVRLGAGESLENTRFSLDKGETFQGDNTFMGVAPGIYDVLVDNGCSEYEETIVVGGVQAFFTPNGDNSNDSWTLNNPTFFPGYKISIFDRYGKLLTMLTDTSSGWDGTYQGQDMPADGYWYYLELVDGRTAKGSFTLKR